MSNAELSGEVKEKILDALAAGRRIEAIKLYREATGKDLAEANDFIDRLSKELAEQHPESVGDKSGGCLGVILLGLAAGLWLLCELIC